jgi:hypothetical protein
MLIIILRPFPPACFCSVFSSDRQLIIVTFLVRPTAWGLRSLRTFKLLSLLDFIPQQLCFPRLACLFPNCSRPPNCVEARNRSRRVRMNILIHLIDILLFIYSWVFNDAVSIADLRASNFRVTGEQWTGKMLRKRPCRHTNSALRSEYCRNPSQLAAVPFLRKSAVKNKNILSEMLA